MTATENGNNGNGNGSSVAIEDPYGSMYGSDFEILAEHLAKEFKNASLNGSISRRVFQMNQEEIAREMKLIILRYSALSRGLVTRMVTTDGPHDPRKAVMDTRRFRVFDTKADLVDTIPQVSSGTRRVIFFRVGRTVDHEELEQEYVKRGLRSDPIAQCAVIHDEPDFPSSRPCVTHWKGKKGEWCYLAFNSWNQFETRGYIAHTLTPWGPEWWFAGTEVELK